MKVNPSKKILMTGLFAFLFHLTSCHRSDQLEPSLDIVNQIDTLMEGDQRGAFMRENQQMTANVAWPQSAVIRIHFLNGTAAQQDTVRKYAQVWDDLTNLEFQYVNTPAEAQVRILFDSGTSSGWSYVGYQSHLTLLAQPNSATMALYANIGREGSRNIFAIGTIRHEFGHLLGLQHEQLRPDSDINWINTNTRGGTVVTLNTFRNFLSSGYDPLSIMHYSVRVDETTDGRTIPGYINADGELSPLDTVFIQSVYPPDRSAPDATTLATRD